MKIIQLLKNSLLSPSVMYVILRYITYIIQFVNALLLAKLLGEHEFGVYSFSLLVMQYMSYTNLGLNDSLNTEYAANVHNEIEAQRIWDNAWSLDIIINIIILTVCIPLSLFFKPFEEFHYSDYSIGLLLACVLFNMLRIYITYNRLWGKLGKLNIQQLMPHLFVLISIIFFKQYLNTKIIVYLTVVAYVISVVIFRINLYRPPKFHLDIKYVVVLIKRGISLLVYNFSFYLMTLVASSLVSKYFSVEQFGCYSFANTLVNGVVMAGGAFMFIIYPKMINRFSIYSDEDCLNLIHRIRSIYVVSMDTISLVAIVFSLALIVFLPQYKENLPVVFSLLMVAQICTNSTAGYASLIVARKKEMKLVFYSFISVFITLVLSIILMRLYDSLFIIPGVLCISSTLYSILVIRLGSKLLNIKNSNPFLEFILYNKWLPLLLIPLNAYIIQSDLFLVLSLLVYLIVNVKNILNAAKTGLFLLSNKDLLKL